VVELNFKFLVVFLFGLYVGFVGLNLLLDVIHLLVFAGGRVLWKWTGESVEDF